ncbi:MAG: hypothetical protein Q7V53_03360 [Caldisericota bacterium]|nr:hypothetical protein [Caldisericota bacterium]
MRCTSYRVGTLIVWVGLLLAFSASTAYADPFGWAGGYNFYQNRGVAADIETANPYSPSPGYSSAYVMTCQVSGADSEYIQIGWTKDVGLLSPDIQYFWEWWNDYTEQHAQSYWGSPSVGSYHNYMIYANATSWIFALDGVGLTSMPVGYMTYWPNEIQFFGETSDYYHNRYPGSTSNACNFNNGKYYYNGSWWKAYYYNEADTYSSSSAGSSSSSSFSINDTR